MFLNALSSEIPAQSGDVVIVGAGPAGLTLATALEAAGVDCIVVEAGGHTEDAAAQALYRAASISSRLHSPTQLYRRRGFGGTSAIWGGRCIPFDPIDFEARDWIPHSGRPISAAEATRRLGDAMKLCKAGEPTFDAAQAIPGSLSDMVAGRHDPDLVLSRIERFSEPTHFGREHRQRIARSKRIRVILNAHVTALLTEGDETACSGVEAVTLDGRKLRITGRRTVIAAGGLETPRLLLASGAGPGMGNRRGLVGRFYQSHIEGCIGSIRFRGPARQTNLGYEISWDGVYCRRYMALSAEAQRRERLAGLVIRPHHPDPSDPSHRDPILSAMHLAKGFLSPEYALRVGGGPVAGDGGRRIGHLANIATNPVRLMAFTADWTVRRTLAKRKLPSVFLNDPRDSYVLDFNAEQLPDPENRVALSHKKDRLGVPMLDIRWGITGADRSLIRKGLQTMRAATARGDAIFLDFDEAALEASSSAIGPVGGHHMGAARMADHPSRGVVDRDCQVFGVKGLYVAGAAVFPTSGFANPTLMIVSLALRLAEHLAGLPRA